MLQPLIGRHPDIRRIRNRLDELAATDKPLVFVGEAGTGKSLVAAHLHNRSPHKDRPLKRINFSVLTDRDGRIELFGAEPPELSTTRRGILDYHSTLLIKHVDYAAHYIQDQLADVLSTRRLLRNRLSLSRPVSGRLIFTLRDCPATLRRQGRISPKLHDWLIQHEMVRMPSLRERACDFLLLVKAFRGAMMEESATLSFLRNALIQHRWSRNLSELRAFLRLVSGPTLEESLERPEHLLLEEIVMMVEEGREVPLSSRIELLEGQIVHRALRHSRGSQVAAARLLGISDRTIRRQLGRQDAGT